MVLDTAICQAIVMLHAGCHAVLHAAPKLTADFPCIAGEVEPVAFFVRQVFSDLGVLSPIFAVIALDIQSTNDTRDHEYRRTQREKMLGTSLEEVGRFAIAHAIQSYLEWST